MNCVRFPNAVRRQGLLPGSVVIRVMQIDPCPDCGYLRYSDLTRPRVRFFRPTPGLPTSTDARLKIFSGLSLYVWGLNVGSIM